MQSSCCHVEQRVILSLQHVFLCSPVCCLLQAGLGPHTSVFLSDVTADVWPPGTLANLSMQSACWLVTQDDPRKELLICFLPIAGRAGAADERVPVRRGS